MFNETLSTVQGFVTGEFFFAYILLVSVLSIFVFWRSVQRARREDESTSESGVRGETGSRTGGGQGEGMDKEDQLRWRHKIFDLLIFSLITALIIARVAYIIFNPDDTMSARWFWIPYERIEGDVFLFASLPWLFLRFWDGGILIEGLVFGWMISIVFFSRLMNIKWGIISNAVADFFWFWFVGIGMYLAILWGVWWMAVMVLYLLILGFVRWRSNRQKAEKGPSFMQCVISVVWKVSVIIGIPAVMLINNVFFMDASNVTLTIILGGATILVGFGILAGDLLEFFSILQTDVSGMLTKDSSKVQVQREISPDGTEIVGSDTPEAQGWRRFTTPDPVAKKPVNPDVPRNFSRSYKHFTSGWKDAISVLLARITRSKSGGSDEQDQLE